MIPKDTLRYLKMHLMLTGLLRQHSKSQSMLVVLTHGSRDRTNLHQLVESSHKPITVNMLQCKRNNKSTQTTSGTVLLDTSMAPQPRKENKPSHTKESTGSVVVLVVTTLELNSIIVLVSMM